MPQTGGAMVLQARDGGTSSSSSSGGVGKKAQEAPQGGGVQQANARAANSLRSLRHSALWEGYAMLLGVGNDTVSAKKFIVHMT
eukprot:1136811-Pelagomonas_calceolata.AAC.12